MIVFVRPTFINRRCHFPSILSIYYLAIASVIAICNAAELVYLYGLLKAASFPSTKNQLLHDWRK